MDATNGSPAEVLGNQDWFYVLNKAELQRQMRGIQRIAGTDSEPDAM